jgi:hypothetical protein
MEYGMCFSFGKEPTTDSREILWKIGETLVSDPGCDDVFEVSRDWPNDARDEYERGAWVGPWVVPYKMVPAKPLIDAAKAVASGWADGDDLERLTPSIEKLECALWDVNISTR